MTKAIPPPPPPSPDQSGLLESIKKWGLSPPSAANVPPPPSAWELMARPEVIGLYYRNQHIVIDGYKFVNCRFDNCTIETRNGNFDIVSCIIDNSNQLKYGSESRKAIQLFTSRYDWAPNFLPSAFVGRPQPDGTITITSGL